MKSSVQYISLSDDMVDGLQSDIADGVPPNHAAEFFLCLMPECEREAQADNGFIKNEPLHDYLDWGWYEATKDAR